ncbi:MAG TPA: PKD domain-containing protein [Fimbriimonadaceae bacterium]|nr:PKD domain-containing protein [Fimbriimonadaceae bacterium]
MSIANAQVVVYAPEMSIADQHISLRGWGSGTIAQTDELAYSGTNSIRVSSRNYFQGGIMTFGNPVNLASAFDDNSNMLRLTVQVPDVNTTLGGPGGGPGKGNMPGKGIGPGGPGGLGAGGGAAGAGIGTDAGGGQTQGRGAGGQQPGAPGGANKGAGSSTTETPQPPLSRIRVIVTTSDGKKSEAYIDLTTSGAGERGWKQVAIPLKAITGFDRTNKMVKELAFSGDSVASFYVGDIKVINDTTPITGEARIDHDNLALGDEALLTGDGFGGASVLKYEWDFNSDGKVDATGQFIKHKFRTPGDFTVTLTISDMYGLKPPYKTQVKVHVNP